MQRRFVFILEMLSGFALLIAVAGHAHAGGGARGRPTDSVVLHRSDSQGSSLEWLSIESGGKPTVVARTPLDAEYFPGLALIDDETVLLVRHAAAPERLVAEKWKRGSKEGVRIGTLPPVIGSLAVDSYSRRFGSVAIYDLTAGEGAGSVGLAKPGATEWLGGDDIYRALQVSLPEAGRRYDLDAAAYSPDGRTIGLAVSSGGKRHILLHDLVTNQTRTLGGPREGVLAVSLSQDARTVCWLESALLRTIGTFAETGEEPETDEYMDAAFGVVSVPDSKVEYHWLSRIKDLPRGVVGFPTQGYAHVGISRDGKRVFMLLDEKHSYGLFVYDRTSRRWSKIADGVLGFAVIAGSSTQVPVQ